MLQRCTGTQNRVILVSGGKGSQTCGEEVACGLVRGSWCELWWLVVASCLGGCGSGDTGL